MQEIFELEIWSRPERNLSAEAGKELEIKISNDLNLDSKIILGLSFLPDKTHVDNLLIAINEKELFVDDFSSYCDKYNISKSIHNMRSAAYYLDYVYGRPLAWIHIPHDKSSLNLYHKILKWCYCQGYNIQNGDKLYCIVPNLEVGKNYPIGW